MSRSKDGAIDLTLWSPRRREGGRRWGSVRMAVGLLAQRMRESDGVLLLAVIAVMLRGGLGALLGRRRTAVAALAQAHRTTRHPAIRRIVEPYIVANRAVAHAPPAHARPEALATFFGTRMSVLKEPRGAERGVLFVMFSELLPLMFATMDVRQLVEDYTIVVEPSWSGYCDEDFLRLTQLEDEVFILAAQPDDFAFLTRLRSNLVPVPLGPCDWVDPAVALPYLGNPKEFDLVMNAHWGASKRHHVLFRLLARARRNYRVLLIGGAWEGRTQADVRALASHFGVAGQVTLRERLPYEEVMDLTCRARVALLLSLKEGSNRAIAESLFCNVPAVVLSNHVGGIVKNIRPETGRLVPEAGLEEAIESLLHGTLAPRQWAEANISCFESSARLNALLQSHARARGRPWTRDIAMRANSPESRYVRAADAERLAPWNARLAEYLAPGGTPA